MCFCGIVRLDAGMFDLFHLQTTFTSGQVSVLRLPNVSSQDHNKKISCIAENIVGEKESSLLLNILCGCGFVTDCPAYRLLHSTQWLFELPASLFFSSSFQRTVPPKITKLSDAISDHHWCIPFSVTGERRTHTHPKKVMPRDETSVLDSQTNRCCRSQLLPFMS